MDCFFGLKAVFPSANAALVSFLSLSPELNQKHEKRSKTSLFLSENALTVQIKAFDEKSLKASVNTYLKLLNQSIKAMEVS